MSVTRKPYQLMLASLVLCAWTMMADAKRLLADEAQDKLGKMIESQLRGGKEDWFVIGLSVTTFHSSVERTLPPEILVAGAQPPAIITTRDFRISRSKEHPVTEFTFHAFRGRVAAKQAILDHLAKFPKAPMRDPRVRAGRSPQDAVAVDPPPVGGWSQVGHFSRQDAAERGVLAAVNTYNTTPRWFPMKD